MHITRTRLLLMAFSVEGTALLAALALGRWLQIDLHVLPVDPTAEVVIAMLATVPPIGLFIGTTTHRGRDLPIFGSLRKTLLGDIRNIFINAEFADLVVISTAAACAEEALFRGVIQTELGLVAASLVFGLAHCVTPAYFVAATIMGFYIGLVYSLVDSLFVVIVVHGLYDLFALVYLRYYAADDTC